jgi:iron complex transport system substrate-binding protein
VRYADVLDLVESEPALRSSRVLALNPNSLDEILQDVLCIGQAAGAAEAAAIYLAELQARIDRVRHFSDAGARRPSVVVLEWLDPLMTAGNWTPHLVHLAGGAACLAEPGRQSDYVQWQAVRDCDPDVLIAAPCGFDLPRTLVEAQHLPQLPGWSDLSAFKSGKIFAIDGNAYLNRSGPRIVDSLEILAHLIRPDRSSILTGELAEGRAWSRLLPS